MAKMGMNNGNGDGKQVLEVRWEDAVPFALELKQRWPGVKPAIPERIRYVELNCRFPDPCDPGEPDRFGRSGQNSRPDGEAGWTVLPGILLDGADDD
jgi:hypothetical protein